MNLIFTSYVLHALSISLISFSRVIFDEESKSWISSLRSPLHSPVAFPPFRPFLKHRQPLFLFEWVPTTAKIVTDQVSNPYKCRHTCYYCMLNPELRKKGIQLRYYKQFWNTWWSESIWNTVMIRVVLRKDFHNVDPGWSGSVHHQILCLLMTVVEFNAL